MNDKLKSLIQLLTEKTKKKEAVWNKASGNNQFKLLLPDNIAVTVSYYDEDYNNPDSYAVAIFNSNGDVIQRFSAAQEGDLQDYNLLSTFHQAASDVYYKVEETFDTLIQSVKSEGTIGTIETNTSNDNTSENVLDDLPF